MRRDDERFAALYQKYYWRIVGFYKSAFRLEQQDAEDLTQEAFVRFLRALEEYRGDAEWAFFEKIARNVAYNHIRHHGTQMRGAPTVDLDDPNVHTEVEAKEEAGFAEREEARQRVAWLRDAIAALPAGQRQCLQLQLQGFTGPEIAKFLGISHMAVRSRIRDARRSLRASVGNAVDELPEDES